MNLMTVLMIMMTMMLTVMMVVMMVLGMMRGWATRGCGPVLRKVACRTSTSEGMRADETGWLYTICTTRLRRGRVFVIPCASAPVYPTPKHPCNLPETVMYPAASTRSMFLFFVAEASLGRLRFHVLFHFLFLSLWGMLAWQVRRSSCLEEFQAWKIGWIP